MPKGQIPWNKGKKGLQSHNKKSRKKMSLAKIGLYIREKHPNWKGGKTIVTGGYIWIKLREHPDSNANGYILEHRLVAEKMTGRRIRKNEDVHHINGNKKDNRPENLEIMTKSKHHKIHDIDRKRNNKGQYLPCTI